MTWWPRSGRNSLRQRAFGPGSECSTSPPAPATLPSPRPAQSLVVASDLCREAIGARACGSRRPRGRRGVPGGQRRGASVRRRRVRHRDLVYQGHISPRTTKAVRRRAGPGHRPGGTVAILSWTPGFHRADVRHHEAVCAGAAAPAFSRRRCGATSSMCGRCSAIRVDCRDQPWRTAGPRLHRRGAAFRDYFKTYYGPTITAYRGIAEDTDKVAALDADLRRPRGSRELDGSSVMNWGVPDRHRTPPLSRTGSWRPETTAHRHPGPGLTVARLEGLHRWVDVRVHRADGDIRLDDVRPCSDRACCR